MGTKYQQAVYEWFNISGDLVYECARFFKGQWGRFEILARTPVPKLPSSYIPLPPPHARA